MLEDLVARKILPDDEVLLREIEQASLQPNSFLAVINFSRPRYEFVGPTCYDVTGYKDETFLKGGSEFVFSITTQETSLAMIQNMASFSLEAKVPGFDPCTMRVNEYQVALRSGFGSEKRLIILGLPLTYTVEADMELGVVLHAEVNPDVVATCKKMLTRIKERHNLVYQHAALQNKQEPLLKVFVQQRTSQKLTLREEEVLKLLAKGFTSKQIAAAIFIEETTVETHRKNLFKKFETKNIAELIKKASKQYWLE